MFAGSGTVVHRLHDVGLTAGTPFLVPSVRNLG